MTLFSRPCRFPTMTSLYVLFGSTYHARSVDVCFFDSLFFIFIFLDITCRDKDTTFNLSLLVVSLSPFCVVRSDLARSVCLLLLAGSARGRELDSDDVVWLKV